MSSSDRMNDLSGHVVLVTGATDGLGRALCAELVELRAAVLVHGRSPERIEATVEELRSATATAQVRGYYGTRAYCQSKLAQVLQCFDLAEGWALDRRPEGVAERLRPVLLLGTCRARRGQAAARRASHRASGGAPSSMTNSRSTCTASTKVVFAPEPTAVASTA